MDLAVVAALVARENLTAKASTGLPLLLGSEGLRTATLDAPRQIASRAAVMNKGHKWMIAVGGVQINPWTKIDQAQRSASLDPVHVAARPSNEARWWWD
jgi:hypothetical protein